jgi:tetratricopeptide (TPR) repeat protein
MMAQTKKALCYFIMGKTTEALAMVNIILKLDDAERMNYERGMPNSYSRLKTEFEKGKMFATAEELKSFTDKSRVAIIVADYYYEMEQWKEAADRYGRIDWEMRKHLNLKACAYLDFMLGNCTVMTEHNDDKALKYFGKFRNEYRNTPTYPRAMMAMFMAYQNKGEYDKALNTLKEIQRKAPRSEWGKRAYYHQGELLYARGQNKEAQEIFEVCLKQCADTWLARGAGQYLEKIKDGEK